MGDLDGRNRLLARAHALEPIAVVIGAHGQVEFVRTDLRVENLGVAGVQGLAESRGRIAGGDLVVAASDEDPAVGAFETDAIGEVVVNGHAHAVGVVRLDLEVAVDVPKPVLGEVRPCLPSRPGR